MRGKKTFCICAAWTYHVILKEVENHIFKHNWVFRHLLCINNPHWQSSGNTIFLCKYIVISDTLIGSFFDVLFWLLVVILSELHLKSRRKDWDSEKIHRRICVRDIHFLTAPLLSMPFFVAFFVYSLPLPKWCTCSMARMGCVLCDDVMSERSSIWKSLAI